MNKSNYISKALRLYTHTHTHTHTRILSMEKGGSTNRLLTFGKVGDTL